MCSTGIRCASSQSCLQDQFCTQRGADSNLQSCLVVIHTASSGEQGVPWSPNTDSLWLCRISSGAHFKGQSYKTRGVPTAAWLSMPLKALSGNYFTGMLHSGWKAPTLWFIDQGVYKPSKRNELGNIKCYSTNCPIFHERYFWLCMRTAG